LTAVEHKHNQMCKHKSEINRETTLQHMQSIYQFTSTIRTWWHSEEICYREHFVLTLTDTYTYKGIYKTYSRVIMLVIKLLINAINFGTLLADDILANS